MKDEHVELSEMDFRRFWARREPSMVQMVPILVGSTGPLFAPYLSARLAVNCSKVRTTSAGSCTASEGHLPKPVYPYGFMLYWAKKSQEHTENQKNACDSCMAGG